MRFVTIALLCLMSVFADAQLVDGVSVYATGGKSMTNWHGQAGVVALNVELTRSLSPRTELGMVFSPMTVRQPRSWFGNDYGDGNENVEALLSSFVARRNFHVNDPDYALFAEMSFGPMWAQKRVPADTSRFNFASQAGIGVILRPHSAMPVILGYRFMHISNGGYADRNPGLNVSSLVIGTKIRLGR